MPVAKAGAIRLAIAARCSLPALPGRRRVDGLTGID